MPRWLTLRGAGAGDLCKIEDQRKYREGFYRFIRHPLRVMMEDPVTVLFISVPAALLLLIGGGL